MAYKVIRLILLAIFCAKQGLADVEDSAHLGKAISKAFVPTRQMLRLSGSMSVSPEAVEVVTGSRFHVHEVPSSNQFGSALHMREMFKERSQELTEGPAFAALNAEDDPKYAQHGFGFGRLMGLMASVGLVASIGIAAVRKYFAHEHQSLLSTVGSQISLSPQKSRPIVAAAAAGKQHTLADFKDPARKLTLVVGYCDPLNLPDMPYTGEVMPRFQPAVMLVNPMVSKALESMTAFQIFPCPQRSRPIAAAANKKIKKVAARFGSKPGRKAAARTRESYAERIDRIGAAAEKVVSSLGRDMHWRRQSNDANAIVEVFGCEELGKLPAYSKTALDFNPAGHVVLDLGGHIGTFAVQAMLAGASKVIGYEPHPENVELYRANTAGFNVELHPRAVIPTNRSAGRQHLRWARTTKVSPTLGDIRCKNTPTTRVM